MNRKKYHKHSKQKQVLIFSWLGCIVLGLIIGIFVGMAIASSDNVQSIPSEPIEEAPKISDSKPITEDEPEKIDIEAKKDYPKPEYSFDVENVYIEIPGLKKPYTYAWVSDVHLITDIEAGDVADEHLATIKQRYDTLSITDNGEHAKELWPEIVKYLNYYYGEGDLDAVIFGGDLLDYYSSKNFGYFKTYYEMLDIPTLYIRADHDYGAFYGASEAEAYEKHDELDDDDWEEKYIEEQEFIILGINGSTKDIPEERLPYLEEMFSKGKPVIVATHVPYEAKVDTPDIDESLEELSMRVRNKIYYWGGGNYEPNDKTKKYFDMIYAKDTPVVQVLAGHMHEKWDGLLTDQVSQHIFTPAFKGVIGMVHVVPAGYEVPDTSTFNIEEKNTETILEPNESADSDVPNTETTEEPKEDTPTASATSTVPETPATPTVPETPVTTDPQTAPEASTTQDPQTVPETPATTEPSAAPTAPAKNPAENNA